MQHEYEGIGSRWQEYDDDDYDGEHDDNNVDHDEEVDERHPKQHENEGIDDGLEEAETGADACNCQAEERKLSPEIQVLFKF